MSVERQHALLSASSSERWINCPGSARLEEGLPDTTSKFAAEGTLAHSFAEITLRHALGEITKRTYNSQLKKLQAEPLYDREMIGHAETYANYVLDIVHGYKEPPYVAIERRVDYSHIAPEGFGTADCIVIGEATMHVVDYKYGRGARVEADGNTQMWLYALGALENFKLLYDIREITMHIVQPRISDPSSSTVSGRHLTDMGFFIREAAQAAYNGTGGLRAGDWCQFCRAGAVCRTRSERMIDLLAYAERDPNLLANDEIGDILRLCEPFIGWFNTVKAGAESKLLDGEPIPGWKLVEGRSNRQFTDVDAAFAAAIAAGTDEALLYKRQPCTLTEVEKLLGKPTFVSLLNDYIVKPPGKPTIAPEDDKREAYNPKVTAADAFGVVNQE